MDLVMGQHREIPNCHAEALEALTDSCRFDDPVLPHSVSVGNHPIVFVMTPRNLAIIREKY